MSDFETLIQSRLLKLHLTVLTGVRIYTTSNHHPLTIDIHCTKLSLKMVCFHKFRLFPVSFNCGTQMFWVNQKWCPHPRSQGTPKTSMCASKILKMDENVATLILTYPIENVATFSSPTHVFLPNGLARHSFFLDLRYNDDDLQGQMFHIQMLRAISLAQKSLMNT